MSGVTAARTDTEINNYIGRGGWTRLYDVPIASGRTQINLAGALFRGFGSTTGTTSAKSRSL